MHTGGRWSAPEAVGAPIRRPTPPGVLGPAQPCGCTAPSGASVSRGTSFPRTKPSCTPWRPNADLGEPAGGGAPAVPRQRVQVVPAGDDLGGQPGQRDVQRVGRRGPAAEVDDEAEVVVLVGTALADPERRRDVVRRADALALRVLGRHRRDLTGPGEVGRRRHVTAGEHVVVAGHLEVLVDVDPAVGRGGAEPGDERLGPHADAPDQRPGGDDGAVTEPDAVVHGLGDGGLGPDLHAALAQDAVGGPAQALAEPRQHPGRGVDQEPAGLLPREPGCSLHSAWVMRTPWAVTSVPV